MLSAEEAALYTLATVMGQDDDWQPTLATEQAPVPTNVTVSGASLKWDGSNYALLWAICKDGRVIAFTTEPTFTATDNGVYTVRAANEMGGLSIASEAVTVTEASGIRTTESASATAEAYYSVDGKRIPRLQSGLNIVRMSDGNVQKILSK